MQSQTSIYHKLILYIFFLGIFVIVVVSLYSFFTARNAIMDRTFDQLTSLRVSKKAQVEQFFNDRLKEVELFSRLENPVSLKSETMRSDEPGVSVSNPAGLDADFTWFFRTGNYYSAIYIVYSTSIEAYNFDSVPGNLLKADSIEMKNLGPVISKARSENTVVIKDYSIRSGDSLPHLYIASPFLNSAHSNSAFVVFEIRPSSINSIMESKDSENGLGKSGEVYLIGPDSLMRTESRFFKRSTMHLLVKTQSVRNAFNSGDGSQILNDYRGIATLSSYSRVNIPGLNWVIISEIDKKEAMRPVYKLANEIVFLSIFITMILFAVAYFISRAITRPIIELKNATVRVRKGELDQELPVGTNDELGELTESFNLMTSQLKSQQDELKERETKIFSSFIDGQEDERQRLSRELHDGLGQMIIATKLKTETLVNSGNGLNNENISRLRFMFDSLVDEVRSISNNLMPAVLQEFGLETALNQICQEIAEHSRIKIIFDSRITGRDIDKRIVVYVFRIAQEALNNAVKHAGASEIIVTLIANEKMINLMVLDDGIGINFKEPCSQNGRGLNSMCERVKLLNGMIDISKGVDHGTIVSVKIPF